MVSRVFKIKGYQGLSRVDTSVLPGWPDGRGILTSEEPPPEAGHFFFCFHLPASILHLRRPRSLPVKSLHPVLKLHAPLNLIMITPKAGPFFFLLPSLFSLLSSLFSPNEFRAVASIFHLPSPIFLPPSEKQSARWVSFPSTQPTPAGRHPDRREGSHSLFKPRGPSRMLPAPVSGPGSIYGPPRPEPCLPIAWPRSIRHLNLFWICHNSYFLLDYFLLLFYPNPIIKMNTWRRRWK